MKVELCKVGKRNIRDVVRNLVIPQLNHTYSRYNIEFQAVDLRYGINTRGISEKEASQKVLNNSPANSKCYPT
jgi:hypothetical protein